MDNADILQQRLAPGAWIDADGALHFSIPELLEAMDEADTEKNRAAMTKIVHDALRKQIPESPIIHRP